MLIADLTILRRAVPTAGRTRRSLLVIRAAKRPPPLHASGLLRQPAVGKLADANIDAISDERRWKRKGAHYGQFLAPSRGSLPTLPVAICRAPVRRGPKIVVCPLLHVLVSPLLHSRCRSRRSWPDPQRWSCHSSMTLTTCPFATFRPSHSSTSFPTASFGSASSR